MNSIESIADCSFSPLDLVESSSNPDLFFSEALTTWTHEASNEEYPFRIKASKLILECYQNKNSELDLENFHLTTLPNCLEQCLHLKALDVSSNHLIHFPDSLRSLKALKYLHLENNQITSLPDWVSELTQLKSLNASSNQLSHLPKDLGKCTHLQFLSASNNWLTRLPDLSDLNLLFVDFSNNPLLPHVATELSELLQRLFQTIPPYNIAKKIGFTDSDPPLIGFGLSKDAPIFGRKIPVFLSTFGASVVQVNLDSGHINPNELREEVETGVKEIREKGLKDRISIPEALLDSADATSSIGKIRDWAIEAFSKLDALALPGGSDIEAVFYDATKDFHSKRDYRRSITEFALVYAAHLAKKPLVGVCRGNQLLNVYFGGTLLPDVPNHFGWRKVTLTESSRKELFLKTLEGADSFIAYCNHDLACDQLAPNFEVIAKRGNDVECILSKDGLYLGTQFHLEAQAIDKYSNGVRIYEIWFKTIYESRLDRTKYDALRST